VVILAAAVAWRVDAAHRNACIQTGQLNCSWLPWSNGGGGAAGPTPSGGGGVLGGIHNGVSSIGSENSGKIGSGAAQVP
jgi:hypothetical protein